jgi:hypothetical protein
MCCTPGGVGIDIVYGIQGTRIGTSPAIRAPCTTSTIALVSRVTIAAAAVVGHAKATAASTSIYIRYRCREVICHFVPIADLGGIKVIERLFIWWADADGRLCYLFVRVTTAFESMHNLSLSIVKEGSRSSWVVFLCLCLEQSFGMHYGVIRKTLSLTASRLPVRSTV